MSKNTKLISIILVALTLMVAVFAYLNMGDMDYKKQLEENAQFVLISGETRYTVGMEDILSLEPCDFTAVMDTSVTKPTEVALTGVPLTAIFALADMDITGANSFEVRALDGYASAIKADELERAFICIAMDGKALGNKVDGGMGPYLMVIKDEQFSQRWCKFMQEIEVQW